MNIGLRPNQVKVGMAVMYYPSLRGPGFPAEVAYQPWQLGHGTWVTKLINLPPEYAFYTGKKGDKAHTVFAAALSSMKTV